MIEDRDCIEAALVREAYEQGRRPDTAEEVAEIVPRANAALSERSTGFSCEASFARARAAVEAARVQKP